MLPCPALMSMLCSLPTIITPEDQVNISANFLTLLPRTKYVSFQTSSKRCTVGTRSNDKPAHCRAIKESVGRERACLAGV